MSPTDEGEVNTDEQELSGSLVRQLLEVVKATRKYHDINVALAEGYAPTDVCAQFPEGAMGYHYVNYNLVTDGKLNRRTPEVLLYAPGRNGARELVGVEYMAPIVDANGPYFGCGIDNNTCPPSNPPPAPSLFSGVKFDGPMAGHEAGMPWHYDQHVWLYKANPSGLFFHVNPRVKCP